MTLIERLRLDYCYCHEGFTCRGLTDPSCESCSTKDERNEAADLIEQQAKRIAELMKVVDAAKNLIAQHGRHNTAIAYERLRFAVATMKGQT